MNITNMLDDPEEGHSIEMNAAAAKRAAHRPTYRGVLVSALLAAVVAVSLPAMSQAQDMGMKPKSMTPMVASAQTTAAAIPSSVLLFPAVITSEGGDTTAAASLPPNQKIAQGIVTDSLRQTFERAKVGLVVYSRKLPSMQRAVQEGVKPEDAANGPGDDPRKAQRFANILGANEYVTTSIDNYKYDTANRQVTFNLSVTRYAADGTALGATAVKAIGSAPTDISGSHQESYAVETAAQVYSVQAIEGVYPQLTAVLNPPKDTKGKKHNHKFASLLLIPIVAIGAALIGPRT